MCIALVAKTTLLPYGVMLELKVILIVPRRSATVRMIAVKNQHLNEPGRRRILRAY